MSATSIQMSVTHLGLSKTGSNLENIWFLQKIQSPSVASPEASTSSASVYQNTKDQQEKRIISSIAIPARFCYVYF